MLKSNTSWWQLQGVWESLCLCPRLAAASYFSLRAFLSSSQLAENRLPVNSLNLQARLPVNTPQPGHFPCQDIQPGETVFIHFSQSWNSRYRYVGGNILVCLVVVSANVIVYAGSVTSRQWVSSQIQISMVLYDSRDFSLSLPPLSPLSPFSPSKKLLQPSQPSVFVIKLSEVSQWTQFPWDPVYKRSDNYSLGLWFPTRLLNQILPPRNFVM